MSGELAILIRANGSQYRYVKATKGLKKMEEPMENFEGDGFMSDDDSGDDSSDDSPLPLGSKSRPRVVGTRASHRLKQQTERRELSSSVPLFQ
jgi:hypothetical protein